MGKEAKPIILLPQADPVYIRVTEEKYYTYQDKQWCSHFLCETSRSKLESSSVMDARLLYTPKAYRHAYFQTPDIRTWHVTVDEWPCEVKFD